MSGDVMESQAADSVPWYGADASDDDKALVTAKGWDQPSKAIKSYRELERFRGAPAERLVTLPEKPDDPAWAEVRARVGWKAPDRPEDYGIAVPDGHPPEYAKAIAEIAHQRGIPKEDLLALVEGSDKAVKALQQQQDQVARARLNEADQALEASLGSKHAETMELVQRELARVGFSPELVEHIEGTIALRDVAGLQPFRQLLIDLALARREGPFHSGATQLSMPSAETAQARLSELATDADWVTKAMQRGTPEAKERLRLNMLAAGKRPDEDEVSRLANAVYGTV